MAAETSATGLGKTTEAALSYVLGPITGVIFLVLSKDKFVRFHAMQSIVLSVTFILVQWISGIFGITIILLPLVAIFNGLWLIIGFIVWLLLIYKAWQGEEWEVPVLGKFARQFLAKV